MSAVKMTGTSPDPAIDSTFQRADRDPGITRAGNPDPEQESTADLPCASGSTTLGNIRPFYANDNLTEIDQNSAEEDNDEVDPPPNSGNAWVPGRDPYAVDGSVDQDYLKNQGE